MPLFHDPHDDLVWAEMLDYWAATGQLTGDEIAAALDDGLDDDTFRSLGYQASYGHGPDHDDPVSLTGDGIVGNWRDAWKTARTQGLSERTTDA